MPLLLLTLGIYPSAGIFLSLFYLREWRIKVCSNQRGKSFGSIMVQLRLGLNLFYLYYQSELLKPTVN